MPTASAEETWTGTARSLHTPAWASRGQTWGSAAPRAQHANTCTLLDVKSTQEAGDGGNLRLALETSALR